MRRRTHNYSKDNSTRENINYDGKYSVTGESEFTRDLTIPFDENEVLTERHYVFGVDRITDGQVDVSPKGNFTGKGPKGYRPSDERIYEKVCEVLWRSPQVDPSEIEVSVEEGIVKLQGVVHKRDFKRWAERLIDNVPGVRDVKNEIKVQTDPGGLIQNRTSMM